MAFKHNTGLTSDGVLQQGDYESTSGHLLDSQAEGDLIVADSSTTMTRLEVGAANTVLTSDGTNPSYNKLTTDNIDATTLVTEADDIASNDNDTSIPTSAAVKDYVDAQVGGTTLTFADDGATTGSVDLDAQQLTVAGTANEIETSASGQTITIGLPNNVTINTLTATNPIATGSGGTGQNLSASTGSMYVASGTVSAVDMTTKGHLLVGDGSGAPSTLAVGTNDYVLTADSAEATGLKWAAAAGGGLSISGTAAQNFTAGDPVRGFNSSGQITGFLKRSAGAGRNWDIYGGGNVSSDVIIPDSTSTNSTLKGAGTNDHGPLVHYLTGENCILVLYIKASDSYLYGRVGTIASNGATTWGTETAIVSSAFGGNGLSEAYSYYYVARATLTSLESSVGSGKMMVSYQPSVSGSSTTNFHRILTIVGGTTRSITVGAEQTQTVTSSYVSPLPGIEGSAGSSEAIVIYAETMLLYAAGVTISGDTITFGSGTKIGDAYGSSGITTVLFNTFVTGSYNVTRNSYGMIAYNIYGGAPYLDMISCTQSGTTLTFQTPVSIGTILSDITFVSSTTNKWCQALVWDTANTRWVCHLNTPTSTGSSTTTYPVIAAFTEASVGTYARVGNTLEIGSDKWLDSTTGVFAHQYSWNTENYQGLRNLLTNLTMPNTNAFSDTGENRIPIVNNNDYTTNPYLRYDSTDSAWYVQSFIYTAYFATTQKVWPLHYKITFDGTDWAVVKATLIDTVDTNVGDSLGTANALNTSRSHSSAGRHYWAKTMYDPDNDWYIKFWYFHNAAHYAGRNAASYNATGDEVFGEGFTYMVWDDDDVNNYAGLYMTNATEIIGIAQNTVSAGGQVKVNLGNQVKDGYSFPSIPTGKPLSRAAIGPDGTVVTYRTRPLDQERTSGIDPVVTIGTAVNTNNLLFGFDTVAMP